ncbi:MAG: MBL fold metallo-hydrolase [Silicimonas sp.]|nr:MBL fold metallo-hydrolase [Silicimonas sp.]
MRSRLFRWIAIVSAGLLLAIGAWVWTIYSVYFAGGQTVVTRPSPADPIDVVPIVDGFYVLIGAGGNITVSVGDDGLLIVDTGYREMSPAIMSALKTLTDAPVARIVNTHAHNDHAEGNAALGQASTRTVAHLNTLESMMSLLGDPFSEEDFPTVTFEDRHVFQFNGQEVELIHAPQAHTNGDAIVIFRPANVIAAGDTFVSDGLPFFSLRSGATLDGHLAAQDLLLALADSETRIVPGHGELADRDLLAEVNGDLRGVRNRLATLKEWNVPRRLRVLFHPLAGWPRSKLTDGDWEKYWTSLVWDSLP